MPSYWQNSFWPSKRVLITGGHGFLGKRLASLLKHEGAEVFTPNRQEMYMGGSVYIERYFHTHRPIYGKPAFDIIFHLAAKVGGIGDVRKNPFPYFVDNVVPACNLLKALVYLKEFSTKVIFAGSVCAYPLDTPMPMREEDLWNGKPEPTNGPYGVAKRALQTLAESATAQYGIPTGYALLANMYGPGDKYDPESSHAIPAIILKMHLTKNRNSNNLELWGSGNPTRDFLYVDDAAEALARMGIVVTTPDPINIGSGKETSIREAATEIAKNLGWGGVIHWDTSRPDGQPRRILDISKAARILEWQPTTFFGSGIELTVADYMHRMGQIIEMPR